MSWLRHRRREPEIQDQLGLDPALLRGALVGLRRINFWSRAHRVLWSSIRTLARETGVRRLSVLDLACGAGDIPIALWQRGRREGLELEVAGCDLNPQTVDFANALAENEQAQASFFVWDVLKEDLPRRFDVTTCSLFLHHLDEGQAVVLLRRMAVAAERLIVVSDLVRCLRGMVLAYLGTRLLPTSPVNRVDSLRSVRAAFTVEEARLLAQRAGLVDATLKKRWPCRFLLTCRPNGSFGKRKHHEEP